MTSPPPPTDRALTAWLLAGDGCDPGWDDRPVTDLPDISDYEEQQ